MSCTSVNYSSQNVLPPAARLELATFKFIKGCNCKDGEPAKWKGYSEKAFLEATRGQGLD